jgi:lipopolysaccharide transport system ATP-binding protein
MSSDVALRVEGLGKRYRIGRTEGFYRYRSLRDDVSSGILRRLRRSNGDDERTLWALRGVSFDIAEGETVGVIGHNGAGKSTLFKLLSKITRPSEGRAEIRGRLGALLEVGTGFHPELSGRENIFLSGAVLGMRANQIARKLDEIVEFAGVERFLDTPIKRYSTGMYLRLAFAVAAHLEPEILLVDEVLSVGDAAFQKKCLGKMAEVGESGRTVLFVSHSMPAVLRLCPRVILLDHGRVLTDGPASEVVRVYLESGLGTSAEREWAEPATAPGDDVARLKAIRVRNHAGRVTEELDIREPLTIEVDYWDLGALPELSLTANVHVFNQDGVNLFASADFNDPNWRARPRVPGVVRTACQVPGDFFAEGKLFVLGAVCSINPPTVHAVERDAVAFQIIDQSDGDGVRGEYASDWPGVVRPRFNWTVDRDADSNVDADDRGVASAG